MAGSKYEALRVQMKELGCTKIDDLSDEVIEGHMLSMSLAFTEAAVAIRDAIVEMAAFAHEIGAFDEDDSSQ